MIEKIEKGFSFGHYYIFTIQEKKKRVIMSSSLEDKIVNHVICKKILLPLDKYLIDSNCATRIGKGTSYARKLLDRYLVKIKNKGDFYVLKFDFSKYFYHINHEVLLNKLEKYLDWEDLRLIRRVLDTTNASYINDEIKGLGMDTFYQKGAGLPIGNYTSQFLAIFYLNDLDHYIKEQLGCKYYIRYMDDGIILEKDKDRLKEILDEIKEKVKQEYLLKLNAKTKIYHSSEGFVFLGIFYQVKENRIFRRIVSSTRRRLQKKKLEYYFKYEKK